LPIPIIAQKQMLKSFRQRGCRGFSHLEEGVDRHPSDLNPVPEENSSLHTSSVKAAVFLAKFPNNLF